VMNGSIKSVVFPSVTSVAEWPKKRICMQVPPRW
jgi:hypothetical protein